MKKCSYCGAEYLDDAVICTVDHTSLDEPTPLSVATVQLSAFRWQRAFTKRVLFPICGFCWIVFGIVAGVLAYRSLFFGSDSQTSILLAFAPVSSESVLLGLIHVVGFCALSVCCLAVGIGLCSYWFEPRKR